MIEDIENCSEEELQKQIAYLEQTPVRGIAAQLRNRQSVLTKGIVRSLRWLGNLKTEFGKIGGRLTPSVTEGEEKFRVSEVVPILRANPGVDDKLLWDIEYFIEKDKLGEVEYNTTIYDFGNEFIMKDGDKRTIAFYENRKESGNDAIEYHVFIVTPLHLVEGTL